MLKIARARVYLRKLASVAKIVKYARAIDRIPHTLLKEAKQPSPTSNLNTVSGSSNGTSVTSPVGGGGYSNPNLNSGVSSAANKPIGYGTKRNATGTSFVGNPVSVGSGNTDPPEFNTIEERDAYRKQRIQQMGAQIRNNPNSARDPEGGFTGYIPGSVGNANAPQSYSPTSTQFYPQSASQQSQFSGQPGDQGVNRPYTMEEFGLDQNEQFLPDPGTQVPSLNAGGMFEAPGTSVQSQGPVFEMSNTDIGMSNPTASQSTSSSYGGSWGIGGVPAPSSGSTQVSNTYAPTQAPTQATTQAPTQASTQQPGVASNQDYQEYWQLGKKERAQRKSFMSGDQAYSTGKIVALGTPEQQYKQLEGEALVRAFEMNMESGYRSSRLRAYTPDKAMTAYDEMLSGAIQDGKINEQQKQYLTNRFRNFLWEEKPIQMYEYTTNKGLTPSKYHTQLYQEALAKRSGSTSAPVASGNGQSGVKRQKSRPVAESQFGNGQQAQEPLPGMTGQGSGMPVRRPPAANEVASNTGQTDVWGNPTDPVHRNPHRFNGIDHRLGNGSLY